MVNLYLVLILVVLMVLMIIESPLEVGRQG